MAFSGISPGNFAFSAEELIFQALAEGRGEENREFSSSRRGVWSRCRNGIGGLLEGFDHQSAPGKIAVVAAAVAACKVDPATAAGMEIGALAGLGNKELVLPRIQ
jgi:hypothetical protein